MTPAKRDEVRGLADRHLAYHPGGLSTCTDCVNARAVLRYVPPGSVKPAATYPMIVSVERREIVVMFRGQTSVMDAALARSFAHALHAAADAAEEY